MKWLRRLALFLLVVGIGLEVGLRLLLGNLAVADLLRWNLPDGRPMGLRPGAEVEYTGYFLKIPPVTQEVNALGYRGPARPLRRRLSLAAWERLKDELSNLPGAKPPVP